MDALDYVLGHPQHHVWNSEGTSVVRKDHLWQLSLAQGDHLWQSCLVQGDQLCWTIRGRTVSTVKMLIHEWDDTYHHVLIRLTTMKYIMVDFRFSQMAINDKVVKESAIWTDLCLHNKGVQ